jgi:hypothetical protein
MMRSLTATQASDAASDSSCDANYRNAGNLCPSFEPLRLGQVNCRVFDTDPLQCGRCGGHMKIKHSGAGDHKLTLAPNGISLV